LTVARTKIPMGNFLAVEGTFYGNEAFYKMNCSWKFGIKREAFWVSNFV